MEIKPNIFKAYDIRGIYGEEITEEAAYLIGKAFVDFFKCKQVVVGRDMRDSSPSLFDALAKGIVEQGADVIDVGMVATPMLSFAVMKWNVEAGIMISASHNAGKYNAFKLIKNGKSGALQIHQDNGIEALKKMVLENNFQKSTNGGKITEKSIDIEYYEHINQFTSNVKDLKIVVDYGNGVGALSSSEIFNKLPIDTIELFKMPDASFPNHEANPHDIANFETLQNKIREEKADLGIFYDGDADRSIIIDENGDVIFPDVELGILALEELKKYPDETFYYDLRFSKSVPELIEEKGGKAIMLRVGNPFYKEALSKAGILAAEFSGHIMFKEHFNIDDGLFAAVKFMDAMCSTKKSASELAKPFEKYFHTEEINMTVKDADKALKDVQEKYRDGNLITIDGLLIQYPDWWLSLRKSNTEPLVRLRLEADTEKLRDEKRKEIIEIITG